MDSPDKKLGQVRNTQAYTSYLVNFQELIRPILVNNKDVGSIYKQVGFQMDRYSIITITDQSNNWI